VGQPLWAGVDAGKSDHYCVVIDADGWIALDASGTMYDFDGAEIRTPLHLLTWIRHLSGKRWFTHHHAGQLIDVVCEAKGWQLPND